MKTPIATKNGKTCETTVRKIARDTLTVTKVAPLPKLPLSELHKRIYTH